MADPISLLASVGSIVDLSIKVIKFVNETRQGVSSVDEDLQNLGSDVKELRTTSELTLEAFEHDINASKNSKRPDDDVNIRIWRSVSSTLKDYSEALASLDEIIGKVKGEDGSSIVDRLKKYARKLAKDEEFIKVQQRLEKGDRRLQLLLAGLHILELRAMQKQTAGSSQEMHTKLSSLEIKLDHLLLLSESSVTKAGHDSQEMDGIATAKSVKQLAWLQEIFMLPRSASNLFMGRARELDKLRQAMQEPRRDQGTKRVVIYGLGGSGKTQLCYKFAQENRYSFWGVFFIDASSPETIQSSYADIAQRIRREPTQSNVNHWLAEQSRPWLLLVDNVDGRLRTHPPEGFIPESQYGLVLFTTRNHELRTQGHGHLVIKLEGLEQDVAPLVLLSAAGQSTSPSPTELQKATKICRKLGFLPIAIVLAGSVLSAQVCTLENCLQSIEDSLARVTLIHGKADTAGPNTNDRSQSTGVSLSDTDAQVGATFDLLVKEITEDAIQLMRVLSFMQSQRFHFQLLLKAIINPQRQFRADKAAAKVTRSPGRPDSVGTMLRNVLHKMCLYMEQLGDRPALPIVLRASKDADPKHAESRLREVLSGLMKLALIERIDDDTYCMHASVTWWIRASMDSREKAIWCQAACNVLAFAILLPPVGIEDGDAQVRRQALPHVGYVRKQEQQIGVELEERRKQCVRSWLSLESTLGSARIRRDAKFAWVYASGGMWGEARELMLDIDRNLVQSVGLGSPPAIRARLFLSETYWWLGEVNEAVDLQEELLAACQSSLGDDHPDTLMVKLQLGKGYWQQGKYHKGRDISQQAVDGFGGIYPGGHTDKSLALSTLGRNVGKLANFDEAVDLHTRALHGLMQAQEALAVQYGDQVLDAKEYLAMAKHDRHRYGDAQPDDLSEAETMASEVWETHKEQSGKQHPKALWASCNLARIWASRGALDKAEVLIREGLPVADRTIGADHIGTLMARAYLGQILILSKKLEEAEVMLCAVVEKHQVRDNGEMHGDHLVAAAFLLDCYRKREKHQQADVLEGEVLQGIQRIFGQGSLWEKVFVGRYTTSVQRVDSRGP